jgi:hypothetical protein
MSNDLINLVDEDDENDEDEDYSHLDKMIREAQLHKSSSVTSSEEEHNRSPLLIRCYTGSLNNAQTSAFQAAVLEVTRKLGEVLTVESISLKTLRERKRNDNWSLQDFVSWLLGSRIHFILAHVHQGMEDFNWSIDDIYFELSRLEYHLGFPNRKQLLCPIFTQDKMEYINCLGPSFSLPTYKIDMKRDMDMLVADARVQKIMADNYSSCKSWILKAPFTTNSQHFKKFVSTPEEAMAHLRVVHRGMFENNATCYEIPYMMLQEKILTGPGRVAPEAKICFLNKKYSHFVNGSKCVKSFSNFSKHEIIAFASSALEALKHKEDQFILDGLVRVDIFKSNQGEMVVNELESLEAAFDSSSFLAVSQTKLFLQHYWESKIYEYIAFTM